MRNLFLSPAILAAVLSAVWVASKYITCDPPPWVNYLLAAGMAGLAVYFQNVTFSVALSVLSREIPLVLACPAGFTDFAG